MRNEDFVEASAYLRVLEKRMLNSENINRIADTTGASEMLRLLSQNSGYDFSSLKRTEDYEFVLKDGLIETYATLYKLSMYREVVDIPAMKYDFHTLKVCLKSKYLGLSANHLFFTVTGLNYSDVEAYVQKGDRKDCVPVYIAEAADEAKKAFEDTKDPQSIDIICDRHMFSRMLSLSEELENDFITDFVKISIDISNVKTMMRVKSMQKGAGFLGTCLAPGGMTDPDFFVRNYEKPVDVLAGAFCFKHFGGAAVKGIEEFGRTGNYGGLEKFLDNLLIEYIKDARYITYGPEVLFSYLISKENEIRQIRILVTCKKNGVSGEALRERLRENFA